MIKAVEMHSIFSMNGMGSAGVITSGMNKFGKNSAWGNIPAKYKLYTYDSALFDNLPICQLRDPKTGFAP
jgi:hypothetical protein